MKKIILWAVAASLAAVVGWGAEAAPDPVHAARTEWFKNAKYGIFVHYLSQMMTGADHLHSDCTARDWDACVNGFDVPRFADSMKRMGAGYVVFTMFQGRRTFAAPNEALARLLGDKPTERPAKRDLIMEIADALEARGISLMLYWTGDGPDRDDRSWQVKTGYTAPINREWAKKWAGVIECASRRYGRKVKGWWFDGCYVKHGNLQYTPALLKLYEEAVHAGNPDAIVAFNNADDIPGTTVNQYVPFEDYTAGEKNYFNSFPTKGRWAGTAQWHILTYLGDPSWGSPGVRLNTKHLAEYIYYVNRCGGVVTVDVMIHWDGGLDRPQVNTFVGVRTELARLSAQDHAMDSKNLAAMRPCRCVSMRGTPLGVQLDCVGSILGATDGNPHTHITGCYEWPWQLEVDLGSVKDVASVHVVYRNRGYATKVRIQVSEDGANWKTVSEFDNDNPLESRVNFPRAQARFLRYASVKPDGPDQPGRQMSVSEIEVFAEAQ